MTESYYRPGLVFLAPKAAALQIPIKDPEFHIYPDGQREQIKPAIWAKFDEGSGNVLSGQETGLDDEGRPLPPIQVGNVPGYEFRAAVADIRGHVLVFDEFAERLGLDAQDRETAARKLLQLAQDPRVPDIVLWEPVAPGVPWPTYDETHHFKIPGLADDLGLVAEALAYERATKNREGVVKALEEKQKDAEGQEALTAA